MIDLSWQQVPPGERREHFVHLLLLADDSEVQVRSTLHAGELYAFCDNDRLVGVVQTIAREEGTVELRLVAIDPFRQGQGVGREMLTRLLEELRAGGVDRVLVGTASSAIGPIAFYQKIGFRVLRVERDYFRVELGYPRGLSEDGIAVRDMIWMDQWL